MPIVKEYGIIPVEQVGLNTPPASPTANNTWLVGQTPEGDWATYGPNVLQQYRPDTITWDWRPIQRDEIFLDRTTNVVMRWDGSIFRAVQLMPLIPPASGRLIYPEIMGVADFADTAMSATQIIYYPVLFDRSGSIAKAHIEVTTATATGTARLSLFADVPGDPGALIAESGTLDCSTTGMRTWTLSSAWYRYPGRYWLAITASSASIVFKGIAVTGMRLAFGKANSAASLATPQTARTENHTYGAFPATATPGGYTTNAIPLITLETS